MSLVGGVLGDPDVFYSRSRCLNPILAVSVVLTRSVDPQFDDKKLARWMIWLLCGMSTMYRNESQTQLAFVDVLTRTTTATHPRDHLTDAWLTSRGRKEKTRKSRNGVFNDMVAFQPDKNSCPIGKSVSH